MQSPWVHASLDAAGQRLVTDVYDYDKKTAKVLLIDIVSRDERVLAEGKHDSADHIEGTHLHPQWSRDEKRIYFNHADSGEAKLYAAWL